MHKAYSFFERFNRKPCSKQCIYSEMHNNKNWTMLEYGWCGIFYKKDVQLELIVIVWNVPLSLIVLVGGALSG